MHLIDIAVIINLIITSSIQTSEGSSQADAKEAFLILSSEVTQLKQNLLYSLYSGENRAISQKIDVSKSQYYDAINLKISDTSSLISSLVDYSNTSAGFDVGSCTQGVDIKIDSYQSNALASLNQCYDDLFATLSQSNEDIYNQGDKYVKNGLQCVQKAVEECDQVEGYNDCYSKAVDGIVKAEKNLVNGIKLYGAALKTAAETLPINCGQIALNDLSMLVGVLLDRLAVCIRSIAMSQVEPVCT